MSGVKRETDPQPASTVIKAFDRVAAIDGRIEPLLSKRAEQMMRIRTKLFTSGFPDEVRLIAAVLLNTNSRGPFDTREQLAYLEALDWEVVEGRGQPVAWGSRHEETVMFRDPGPNQTRYSECLNIGILPLDASLQVAESGIVSVPVTSVESINATLVGLEIPLIKSSVEPLLGHKQPSIPVVWSHGEEEKLIYIGDEQIATLIDRVHSSLMRESLRQTFDRVKSLSARLHAV